MLKWRYKNLDNDPFRSWVCEAPDGSELSVEQAVWPTSGDTIWKALVRIGEFGPYVPIRCQYSAAFLSRYEAQNAAEHFWWKQAGSNADVTQNP